MSPTPILTAAQMAACDRYTIQSLGIPSQILMERAAAKAAGFLLERADLFPIGRVLLLCGGGNNGGDGFAMARFLSDDSLGEVREVAVLYTGQTDGEGEPDVSRMSEECGRQYGLAVDAGITVLTMADKNEALTWAETVVDAVFGIGLDRPVSGELASLLGAVAELGLPTLAVDIPSGVRADTGEAMGSFVRADTGEPLPAIIPAVATVTMQALKPGLLLYPGADLCGEIAVADLGINLSPAEKPFACLADRSLLRRVLPPRARRSHKGTYGQLALLCGSRDMSGAAVLATRGALRSGAGLARVLTPAVNCPVLRTAVPEAIVTPCDTPHEAVAHASADGWVLGCGLGTTPAARETLRAVLDAAGDATPLVLDADGLNLLAEDTTLWDTAALASPQRRVVFTPHPAEMARLCGRSVPTILADPPGAARDYAREHGVTVVLKDAHTVIASPAGELFICAAGNAGLAKGGSGDVLAGIIGALLVQNRARLGRELTVAEVAAAGVYLHARAGDLTARELGEYGMLAGDVAERIPLVCKELSDSRTVLYGI